MYQISRKFFIMGITVLCVMGLYTTFGGIKTALASPPPKFIRTAQKALKSIDSYRIRSEINGHGTNPQGRKETYYLSLTQEIVNRPVHATHLIVKLEKGKAPTAYEMISVGNTTWLNMDMEGWIPLKIDVNDLTDKNDPLNDIPWNNLVSRKKRTAKVNGILCDCYAFSRRDFLKKMGNSRELNIIKRVKGEFCLARKGGFLVHCQVHLEGKDVVDIGLDGTMDMYYDVTDFHKKFDIHPPAPKDSGGVIAGMATKDFPMPEGAKISAAMPHTLILTAPGKSVNAANFYRRAMRTKGWVSTKDETMGGLITLSFKKKNSRVTINITPGENNTLNIMVSDASQ